MADVYREIDQLDADMMNKLIEIIDPVITLVPLSNELYSEDEISTLYAHFSLSDTLAKIDALYHIFEQMEQLQKSSQIEIPRLKYEAPALKSTIDSLLVLIAENSPKTILQQSAYMSAYITALYGYNDQYREDVILIEERLNGDFDYSKAEIRFASIYISK